MKKSIFITVALFAFTSITSQLFAQEGALKTRTKSNQCNERTSGNVTSADDWEKPNAKVANGVHIKSATITCRVTPTDNGCVVTLDQNIVSPRDAASGLPTGKRQHKSMSTSISAIVSTADNSVAEVKSPRDAGSGLATGRRQHRPTAISTSESIAVDEQGVNAKSTYKEFTLIKQCGGKSTKISCDGGDCDIPIGDCPNGDCNLTASWSWGLSQSGSTTSRGSGSDRCSIDFLLQIEDGFCSKMAINEKGTGSTKK